MHDTELILHGIRSGGHRITKVRRAAISILAESPVPLAASDLKERLIDAGINANKTTVYRELAFLAERGVVHELMIGDGVSRYRVCPTAHHHHTICIRCNRVEEIVMKKDLVRQEREIVKRKNFKVLSHTLEFYGICAECGGKPPAGARD